MPPSDNKEINKSGAQSLLCSKFDESEDFITDCPYSTMCMKRIFKLQLPRGDAVETITRGCANQKYTEQVRNFSNLLISQLQESFLFETGLQRWCLAQGIHRRRAIRGRV